MKIDLKKTVLLFASIHLLIAFVAERQEKTKTQVTNPGLVMPGEKVNTQSAVPDKYLGLIYGQP